jgi:hypothetical protein
MQTEKIIELYSGNRNRKLYPLQSSFQVPFESFIQNSYNKNYKSQDPVIDGAIYYKFTLSDLNSPNAVGAYRPGSDKKIIYLDSSQTPFYYPIFNYYKGFIISDNTSGEYRQIKSFDEKNGLITLEYPFSATITPGNQYSLYSGFPNKNYLFIPQIDTNKNKVLDYQLSYNGYYIVFETPNENYSNPQNTNIFYRKISSYDFTNKIAYFDKPLNFDYELKDPPQTFTLRKSLPIERWTIDTPSYYNSQEPSNPYIGPLIGYVIRLPEYASNVDNYYKDKYVYFESNSPETYSPPLPNPFLTDDIIPDMFYPIYGSYYIKAYNGSTRELSIAFDVNKGYSQNNSIPTYQSIGYDNSSFNIIEGFDNIIDSGSSFIANFSQNTSIATLSLDPNFFQLGRTYEFTIKIKMSNEIESLYFQMLNVINFYVSPDIDYNYQTITFTITQIVNYSYFYFFPTFFDALNPGYIEWEFFDVKTYDTINICNYNRNNLNSLSYNGTMTSQNQATCYNISLLSLTLPNVPLLTGSRIAFYPFIYVELSNATSPNSESDRIIYSNNQKSLKALFIASVDQVANPELGTFITLTGSGTQTITFKPNDNLRFSLFLSDGNLFIPLSPDTFQPYEPDSRFQIDAVFSISRIKNKNLN